MICEIRKADFKKDFSGLYRMTDARLAPYANALAENIAARLPECAFPEGGGQITVRQDQIKYAFGPLFPGDRPATLDALEAWENEVAAEMAERIQHHLGGSPGLSIPPEMPRGLQAVARGRSGGILLRMAVGYDIREDRFVMRADMLFIPLPAGEVVPA